MIRMPRPALAVFAGLVVVFASACGSSAATPGVGGTSGPAGATSGPAGTSSVTPGASSVAPGTSIQPGPSFAGDPELAAKFPKQVDGQPVTNVTTARFIDFISAFVTTPSADASTKAEIDAMRQTLSAIGIDLNTIVFGYGTATVNGSSVGIQALRIPGQDANKLIQNYLLFSSSNQGDTLSKETIGGKNVTVVRSSTGFASAWLYATGDIAWEVSTSSQDEAAAVFAALP